MAEDERQHRHRGLVGLLAGEPGRLVDGQAVVVVPDPAPFEVGLLPRDEYIVTGGEYAGQRGFFTRDASGTVTGVDLAGRLATRV
jgi:hypothetical protein